MAAFYAWILRPVESSIMHKLISQGKQRQVLTFERSIHFYSKAACIYFLNRSDIFQQFDRAVVMVI